MNIAVILAGGTGTRMGEKIPKQYIEVSGKPIITYCLQKFQNHKKIDRIIIVASEMWHDYITKQIKTEIINKFVCFASAGSSRQHSIFNGMKKLKEIGVNYEDNIVIHDAARPNISEQTISRCLDSLDMYDGAMPVIPVKDTIYMSDNGKAISSLLNRDKLFAGQAPEGFKFGKYYVIQEDMSEEELASVRGSSEIAYKCGLSICMFPGDEHNYKITTIEDLNKFIRELEEEQ